MDRFTLRQRLQAVEALLQRMEENIAYRGGHDLSGKDVSEATGG